MNFVNNNTKLSIVDNSGVSKFRVISFYRIQKGVIGQLCVGSLNRVKPRRKLKKGQIFRAILVQSRRPVSRRMGFYIRSLASRSILMKRNEYIPLASRLNGYFFAELRAIRDFKFSTVTIYSL